MVAQNNGENSSRCTWIPRRDTQIFLQTQTVNMDAFSSECYRLRRSYGLAYGILTSWLLATTLVDTWTKVICELKTDDTRTRSYATTLILHEAKCDVFSSTDTRWPNTWGTRLDCDDWRNNMHEAVRRGLRACTRLSWAMYGSTTRIQWWHWARSNFSQRRRRYVTQPQPTHTSEWQMYRILVASIGRERSE